MVHLKLDTSLGAHLGVNMVPKQFVKDARQVIENYLIEVLQLLVERKVGALLPGVKKVCLLSNIM